MTSFSDLIAKLSRGEKLDAGEQMELNLQARQLESAANILNGMVRPGTSLLAVDNAIMNNAQAQNLTANNANINTATISKATISNISGSVLHACFVQRLADTTIADTTNTYITPDTVNNFGTAWSVTGDKISWSSVDGTAFHLSGYVIWAGNATGYRALWVEGFDAGDVSLGTAPLHTFAGNNLVDNVCPFSLSFYFNGFSYLKFYVHQTSGGDLTMKEFTAGLSLL